jgi:hypothetical protein
MRRLNLVPALWFALWALSAPLHGAELLVVTQDGCAYCARFEREVAPAYPKTDLATRAPLRRVDLHDLPAEIIFDSPPVFTPTFVLIHENRELGRIEGYSGDEFFWFLTGQLLDRHPQATAP